MSRNTNSLFWVICGAIVILTIFGFLNNKYGIIGSIFQYEKREVNEADDGSIPESPVFIETVETSDKYIVYFNVSKNATRYRCIYGERQTGLKNSAIVEITGTKISCNIPKKDSKYAQVIANNYDKETPSQIIQLN